MGAYAPAPIITDVMLKRIVDVVFRPLMDGLRDQGTPYKGMLYAGLMIKDDQPFVLEFNVRFGDPETQVILPKLKSDLVEVMLATIDGNLSQVRLIWDDQVCLGVVLASGGYPGSYEKGKEIKGLDQLENRSDVFVFHAGTKYIKAKGSEAGHFLTNGGRVLSVVGLAKTMSDARNKVYQAIENIHFDNMHYRRDIGNKAL
jgi:phosphoribosylamine--glycine ligase